MSYKWKIRKGDQVVVLAGKSKGHKGEVLSVQKVRERVIVKGANIVTKHQKPSAQHPQGGLVRQEASVHVSNVAHVDPKTAMPSRVGVKVVEKKGRVLFAKRSGEEVLR